jgi:hypothetical protein
MIPSAAIRRRQLVTIAYNSAEGLVSIVAAAGIGSDRIQRHALAVRGNQITPSGQYWSQYCL